MEDDEAHEQDSRAYGNDHGPNGALYGLGRRPS